MVPAPGHVEALADQARWIVSIRRTVRCGIALALAAVALPGCHSFSRPVSILVRDAETKAPVPGAQVSISDTIAHPPRVTVRHTGDGGIAHVKVTPFAEFAYAVEATAPGYLPSQKDLPVEDVRKISASPFTSHDLDSPTLVVDVFQGPRPTIELTVPTGYRGLLRVELRTDENVSYTPGQRLFRYDVPSTGVVQIVGPPVLLHGLTPDIRVKYPDGTELSREAKDSDVGLRWVSGGNSPVFVIGTKSEGDEARKALEKDEPRGHGGRGSGTRGGGGHHGGGRGGMGGGRGMVGGGMGR
jgi:hypothetical protein